MIVMTAPFSEEKADVRYVLIDGLKFEIKPEDRARTKGRAGGPDAAAARRARRAIDPARQDAAGPAAGGLAAKEPRRVAPPREANQRTRRNKKRARSPERGPTDRL